MSNGASCNITQKKAVSNALYLYRKCEVPDSPALRIHLQIIFGMPDRVRALFSLKQDV